MRNYNIPPIIADWLGKLNNPSEPTHIRDNYRMMIENVVEACNSELTKYKQKSVLKERKQFKK